MAMNAPPRKRVNIAGSVLSLQVSPLFFASSNPDMKWPWTLTANICGRIWLEPDGWSVGIIDQTLLPHRFATRRIASCAEMAHAIRAMLVRGAPLIGAAAAYGVALAMRDDASDENLRQCLRHAGGDAPDGDQSQVGARWNDRPRLNACRRTGRVAAAYRAGG